MISARLADREMSKKSFTELPSNGELVCVSLLCLVQAPAREFAALNKVGAFSYGWCQLSRVFLPKFNLRFRWYDHLKELTYSKDARSGRSPDIFRGKNAHFRQKGWAAASVLEDAAARTFIELVRGLG